MGTLPRFRTATHHHTNARLQGRFGRVSITALMQVPPANHTSVIIPTVTSLQAAIKKYEEQGGTASIFVNDDGMQTVTPELAE